MNLSSEGGCIVVKKNKEMNIVSLIFVITYIIRHRDNLIEKLIYLGIGSIVIYFILFRYISKKSDLINILPSMMLYVAIDQIIYYK